MRILIVGAGDLGQRVARLHRERGDTVIVARRGSVDAGLALDLAAPIDPGVLPVDLDLVTVIVAPDERTPAAYRALYVDGVARLAEAFFRRGARPPRAVFVSSTAVYGTAAADWVDEDSDTATPAWNGQILREAEIAAAALAERVTCVRAAGIYGPGRTMLLDKVRLQRGSASHRWTHRIHIDDLAAVLPFVADRPGIGPALNAVDVLPVREFEVLDHLADQLGLPRLPRADDRDAPDRRISSRRLQDAGFPYRYPDFRSGYQRLVENCVR
jgi:nucleoside-diphosphate-sugar epimerase